jgi:hypothetical protein
MDYLMLVREQITSALYSNASDAEDSYNWWNITAFDSDGFTLVL